MKLMHFDVGNLPEGCWADELTMLPVRSVWEHYVSLALKEGESFQVAVINIDEFQEVNERVGRTTGDKVLQKFARRCVNMAGDALHACRLGGDEFICWGKFSESEWIELLKVFSVPIAVEDQTFVCTVSVGIANAPEDGTTVSQLINRASIASKQAKSSGKNTWRFFTPAQELELQHRTQLLSSLKHALFCDEGLFILYQPQWHILRHEIVGAEVLLRWQHPELGNISPSVFIELAEKGHLINGLSSWVLKQVDKQDEAWSALGKVLPKYSVNVSGKEISNDWYFENLVRSLLDVEMPLRRLTLEITETMMLNDLKDAKDKCNLLKSLGVSLALDDFGVGYSSLGYIKELPFDIVKIDRLLLTDAASDPLASAIFESSLSLFKKIGLRVVVEGVETPEQWDFLKSNGVEMAQGYAIAKPLSSVDFLKFWRAL
jgi:diguanylate cyclase (GGDEF)-like protein